MALTEVKLPCPCSVDHVLQNQLPQHSPSDLGRCFSLKSNSLTSGWVVENIQSTNAEVLIGVDDTNNGLNIDTFSAKSTEEIWDMLTAEGELGFQYQMIAASGAGFFERTEDRKSISMKICQQAVVRHKTKFLKTNLLSSGEAYQQSTYLHDGLKREPGLAEEFINKHGTHYITKVFLGARACREIIVNFSTSRERKKIEAKAEGNIGIGAFKLDMKAAFGMDKGSKHKSYTSHVKISCNGGDRSMLPTKLREGELDNLNEEAEASFTEFCLSVKDDNVAVIGVEANPISSSIVRVFALGDDERQQYGNRLFAARNLMDRMWKWERNLKAAKTRLDRQLEQVGLSKADARQRKQPFQEAVDTFLRAHVKVLIETLERYVNRNVMEIIKGDEQFKSYPPAGTNPGSDPKVDLKDVTIATLGTVTLTEEQMNSLYEDFMAGSVIPVRLSAGKTALWQGPIALGKPCGLPEELRFFHVDVSYEALATQYDEWKSQWKFKVRGQDWNPSTEQPYIDEHTWIEANPEGEIDFEKLPAYFKRVVYYREQNLTDFVEYQGDWRVGHLMGDGQLLYGARGLQGKKSFTAKFEQDAASSGVLEFVDASPYQEYRGCVQLVDWVARMEGPGKVTLKDGTVEYTGHFEDDRIYIPSQEVYDALDPKLQDEKVVLKFWAERDLQRAKYPQELVSAIGAAESLLSKVKNEPLQKALHEARKRLPSTLLLLGPTGAGKTALLNLLGKYKAFRGLPLHMQFPALMAAPNISAPNIESNSGDACTSVPHLYELTLPDQRVLNIIDTPGFDSTGAIQLIKDFCQSHTDISGICYVVNGRVPNRSGIGPEALKSVVDTLPEKVRQRMCAVFTNCSRLTASFTVNDPRFFVLGNTIPAAFHLDNPNEQQHLAPEDGEKLMKSLARTLEQLVEAL